jgi:hypothetical protein
MMTGLSIGRLTAIGSIVLMFMADRPEFRLLRPPS